MEGNDVCQWRPWWFTFVVVHALINSSSASSICSLAASDLTPLLVSEASRVQLPLQHTPLATCLSTSCGV